MVWLQFFSPGRPRPARRNVSSSLKRRRIVADNRAAELPHRPAVAKVGHEVAPHGPPAAPNAPGRAPKEPGRAPKAPGRAPKELGRAKAAAMAIAPTYARIFAWAAIAMLQIGRASCRERV